MKILQGERLSKIKFMIFCIEKIIANIFHDHGPCFYVNVKQ